VNEPGIDEAIWQDVECGAYTADLATWDQLAREASGPVLELGAGTGRVALGLASKGIEVVALDRSAALLAELGARARERGLDVETVCADARELELGRRFAAILAPMQFVHLLGGEPGRAAALRRVRSHLASRAVFAAALLASEAPGAGAGAVLPDVREVDGWIYSSLPVEVAAAGDALEIRRLRQLVSPGGELTERTDAVRLDRVPVERFEREADAAGLRARERLDVPPTADHVGSTISVLEEA
jgi:SAM-dependent methyltransferase